MKPPTQKDREPSTQELIKQVSEANKSIKKLESRTTETGQLIDTLSQSTNGALSGVSRILAKNASEYKRSLLEQKKDEEDRIKILQKNLEKEILRLGDEIHLAEKENDKFKKGELQKKLSEIEETASKMGVQLDSVIENGKALTRNQYQYRIEKVKAEEREKLLNQKLDEAEQNEKERAEEAIASGQEIKTPSIKSIITAAQPNLKLMDVTLGAVLTPLLAGIESLFFIERALGKSLRGSSRSQLEPSVEVSRNKGAQQGSITNTITRSFQFQQVKIREVIEKASTSLISSGLEDFKKVYKNLKIDKLMEFFKGAIEKLTNVISSKFKKLSFAIRSTSIKILVGVSKNLASMQTAISKKIDDLRQRNQTLDKILTRLAAFAALVLGIGKSLFKFSGKIVSTVGRLFSGGIKLLFGFVTKFISKFMKFGWIGMLIGAIIKAPATWFVIALIVGFVMRLFNKIKHVLSWDWWKERLLNMWDGLISGIKWLWDGAASIYNKIIDYVADKMTQFFEWWNTSVYDPFLGPMFDYIKTLFSNLTSLDWWADKFNTAWENIKTSMSWIWDGLKGVFDWITDGVASIMTRITEWWNTSVYTPFLKPAFDIVTNIVSSIMETASKLFKNITSLEWWKSNLSFIIDSIIGVFLSAIDSIKSLIDSILNWIKDSFSTIIDKISSWWANSVYNPFLKPAFDTVNSVIDGMKQFFSNAISNITNWEWWKSNFVVLFDSAVTTIRSFIDPIIETVTSVWNTVKDLISNTIASISTWFTDFYSNTMQPILDPIKDAINKIWNFVYEKLFKTIIKALNKIPFVNIGEEGETEASPSTENPGVLSRLFSRDKRKVPPAITPFTTPSPSQKDYSEITGKISPLINNNVNIPKAIKTSSPAINVDIDTTEFNEGISNVDSKMDKVLKFIENTSSRTNEPSQTIFINPSSGKYQSNSYMPSPAF